MVELGQLRCFVAAAEEMHFGRAAVRLNMSQPSLSRQVQALEHGLRVQLFERANRVVRLTTAGAVFLPEAKRILALTDRAADWTRRAWQGEAGVIRLGFTATAAFADVPLILARAAVAMPGVKILLKEGTTTMQKDALLADMLDAAMLRPPIEPAHFGVLPLRREGFVAAVHAGHPLAARERLTLQDFDGENFIMYSAEGAGYSHDMLTVMFEQARVSPVLVHHLDQNHSILALVSAGLGLALVPRSLTLLALPEVVFREVETDPPEPLEMFMLWRRDNENPVLPAFLSLCRSIFEEQAAPRGEAAARGRGAKAARAQG
jgi:DNA-binding transcriptional LysR family regulator